MTTVPTDLLSEEFYLAIRLFEADNQIRWSAVSIANVMGNGYKVLRETKKRKVIDKDLSLPKAVKDFT